MTPANITQPTRIESFGPMSYVNQKRPQPYTAVSGPHYIRTGTTSASPSKIPFWVVDGPAVHTKIAHSKYNMNDSFTGSNARSSPASNTKYAGSTSRHLTQIPNMSSVLQKYYVSPGSPPLGGRYVPELMIGFLERITIAFESAMGDNAFWKEVNGLIRLSSPQCSPLYQARKITDHIGGATLWMKREDLEHFGSHKAWNITGQLSLAKRMGCKEVVTDCASTKHGKFTALMCAHLNLKCVVIIGADDAEKQENGIHEIEKLGATVLRARCLYGAATLRTAIAEAFRYAALYYDTVYYLMGGVSGPHPIPGMTATFQQRLGAEVAKQFQVESKDQPDALVAAVGTGTGAVGLFRPFIDSAGVRLVGVESAGASPLTKGQVGVLHGAKTLVLQNDEGQILDSNCISPDLNITVVGPEVANWKINGRVEIYTATDEDARRGLEILSEYEDIKAGLDCSHAVIKAMEIAKELGPGKHVILLVTGDDEIDI